MPESRRRKRKKVPTQTGKPKAATMQATTAEPERRWAKGRRVIVTIFRLFVGAVGLFVGAVSLFAAALGIFNEWPRPPVEPTNAPEASNPFSGIFKVANP